MTEEQGKFEGWAIVEVMGHQRYAGFVTTVNFGAASMFRIDVPALPEREEETKVAQYINGQMVMPGSKYRVEPVDAYTKLIGVSAIFAITPCTEEKAIFDTIAHTSRPLIPVNVILRETPKMIEAEDAEEIDDYCNSEEAAF